MSLKNISVPEDYNYIAAFLTLDCGLNCDYCINSYNSGRDLNRPVISGEKWVEGINRLVCGKDLPVSLGGGEPSLHLDFIRIINNIKADLNIDLLTNLSFDVDRFIAEVNPARLSREAPYPNIRVSFHPRYMDLNKLIEKVLKMQKNGFSIGITGILHPQFKKEVLDSQKRCLDLGIDFRTKEFLGYFDNILYGSYLYPDALGKKDLKECFCRTSELIIAPNGDVFRCHRDLYKDYSSCGNLLSPDFKIEDIFKYCDKFGDCNPCDIKIKTNRFQIHGHTAVEIKDVK